MPLPRRAGMMQPPRGSSSWLGNDRSPDISDFFFVLIEEEGDPTDDGKPTYHGFEVYNRPAGNTVEAAARRVLTAAQPGVPIGDATFEPGDYALARLCPGDGGRTWELFAGGSGGGGGGGDCSSCLTLSDLPIDVEELRPDFLLQVTHAAGRCGCTPLTPDYLTDPDAGVLLRFDRNDDGDGPVWKSGKEVELCCGCAVAKLNLSSLTAPVLQLRNFRSCDQGSGSGESGSGESGSGSGDCPAQADLTGALACCGTDRYGRPYWLFVFKGATICSGGREPCDNTMTVRIVCIPQLDCDQEEPALCEKCAEGEAPGLYLVDTDNPEAPTPFGGCCVDYNGRWRLVKEAAGSDGVTCGWRFECGDIVITLAILCIGDTLGMRLTFSGGACGSVVYEAPMVVPYCYGTRFLEKVSGPEEAPETIAVIPQSCVEACPSGEMRVSSDVPLPCTACPPAEGSGWSDDAMTYEASAGMWTKSLGAGGTTPDCEDCEGAPGTDTCKGFGVILRCAKRNPITGRLRFVVFPYCSAGLPCDEIPSACYAGPPGKIEVENELDGTSVLFSVTFTVDDPACSAGSTVVTLTFTNL